MSTIHMGLTAAGATQGTATALSASGTFYEITTCAASADGVQLPSASAGDVAQVFNNTAVTLQVYPQTGGTIAGGASNAADPITAGSTTIYLASSALVWVILPSGKGVQGGIVPQVAVSSATTLTTAQSGFTVLVTGSSSYNITLPAATKGVVYKVVLVANGNAVTVKCPSSLTLLQGGVIGAATVVALAGRNQVTFHASNAAAGDHLVLECDGTNWHTRGWATTAAAFTSAS